MYIQENANGEKHGAYVLWYENGQKMLEGQWRDGVPHGQVTVWDHEGRVKARAEYSNGILISRWERESVIAKCLSFFRKLIGKG